MSEHEDNQELRYIKIRLPSRCALCRILGNLPGLKQKCGKVTYDPELSTIYIIVEAAKFGQVISFLSIRFSAEEVSKSEYSAFSWGL